MKVRQSSMAIALPSLVPPADLARGAWRGFATLDRLADHGAKQGFTDEDTALILQLVKTRPVTIELVDYWRRDILTEEALDQELVELGWDERYRGIIKQAAFPPPGVQDLITMAVREVFTPEIAEAFGQFSDIPSQFIEWAKRVGLSEFWARNYWAAHWRLPGLNQGFDMLHRTTLDSDDPDADTITLPSGKTVQNIVGEASLIRLLRASDVMPFWRGPLIDIAFKPFTRVDVRRMHKLGVLDNDGVYRAYRDIGFNHEKATAMLDFTIAFNTVKPKAIRVKERDLTKADLLGLLRDGIIERDEAATSLAALGYDADETDLLITREEIRAEVEARREDITAIISLVRTGSISFDQGQERLGKLDLTPREEEIAFSKLERFRVARERRPTMNLLGDLLETGMLTVEEWIDEIGFAGFSLRWVVGLTALHGLNFETEGQQTAIRKLESIGASDEQLQRVRDTWLATVEEGSESEDLSSDSETPPEE